MRRFPQPSPASHVRHAPHPGYGPCHPPVRVSMCEEAFVHDLIFGIIGATYSDLYRRAVDEMNTRGIRLALYIQHRAMRECGAILTYGSTIPDADGMLIEYV